MRFSFPPKTMLLVFCLLLNSKLFAQTGGAQDDIPWDYHITNSYMYVMNYGDLSDPDNIFDGESITPGSAVGAFYYNNEGLLQCAGYVEVNYSTITFPVYADDPSTDDIDGVQVDEPIILMLLDIASGNEYVVVPSTEEPVYFNEGDYYYTDGFTVSSSNESIYYGCTDETALNYSPFANIDDGSCESMPDCSMSPPFFPNSSSDCDYSCALDQGVLSIVMNDAGVIELAYDFYFVDNFIDSYFLIKAPDGTILAEQEESIQGSLPNPATQSLSPLVDPVLWSDSITIQLYVGNGAYMACESGYGFYGLGEVGCMDNSLPNYNPQATINNFDCGFWPIWGCTYPEAVNYNPYAVLPTADCDFGSVPDWEVVSSDIQTSIYYTPDGVLLDGEELTIGSYIGIFYEHEGELICVGSSILGTFYSGTIYYYEDDPNTPEIDGFVAGEPMIYMVWDIEADKEYFATPHDASIQTFSSGGSGYISSFTATSTDELFDGCTDALAFNYSALAVIDDESCLYDNISCPEGEDLLTVVIDGGYYDAMASWSLEQGNDVVVNVVEGSQQYCVAPGCYNLLTYPNWSTLEIYTDYNVHVFVNSENIYNAEVSMANLVDATISINSPENCEDTGEGVSEGASIHIPMGWSLISFPLNLVDPNVEEVFSPVAQDIIIVKDVAGYVYLPIYSFNNINDVIEGQAYLVKSNSDVFLPLEGDSLNPEDVLIELNDGWNLIGYIRSNPAPLELVVSSITQNGNLVIVKDVQGNVYLPEWDYNGVGDMQPNHGYQMKVSGANEVLEYLPNDQEY